MKKFFLSTLILALIFLTGCGESQSPPAEKISPPAAQEEGVNLKIKIRIGEKVFDATLEDNSSAREFAKKLPLEVTMEELNGNEKYYRFSENFPSKDERVGKIQAGDLMLYSSSYVVLFYKNFSTNYSYTRLGKIDNPAGLLDVVERGNILVKFEK